jgi:hypothetical protein
MSTGNRDPAAEELREDRKRQVLAVTDKLKQECCCLLLQYLIQSCARGGRRIVEDMCYEIRRAEACVDLSAHHTLVNAGKRDSV